MTSTSLRNLTPLARGRQPMDDIIAVIYCRVSSIKQTVEGGGLGSQESRCREYARNRGYSVLNVFTDDVSGSLIERPGMTEMLRFIKKQKRDCVVLIDDISRFARSIEAHLALRSAIAKVGARL